MKVINCGFIYEYLYMRKYQLFGIQTGMEIDTYNTNSRMKY